MLFRSTSPSSDPSLASSGLCVTLPGCLLCPVRVTGVKIHTELRSALAFSATKQQLLLGQNLCWRLVLGKLERRWLILCRIPEGLCAHQPPPTVLQTCHAIYFSPSEHLLSDIGEHFRCNLEKKSCFCEV